MSKPAPPPAGGLALRLLSVLFSVFLLAAIAFHGTKTNDDDPYRCRALLRNGTWLNPPDGAGNRAPFTNWQPDGCMLRQYSKQDIQRCMDGRHMVFSGDSTTRQVFWAMARLLDRDKAVSLRHTAEKHASYDVKFGGVRLMLAWNPFLETGSRAPEFQSELEKFAYEKNNVHEKSKRDEKSHNSTTEREMATKVVGIGKSEDEAGYKDTSRDNPFQAAGLILVGAGSWFALHQFANESVRNYEAAFNNVTNTLDFGHLPMFGTAPFDAAEGMGNEVFISPVAPPFYDLLPARRTQPEGMHEGEIEAMNDFMASVETSRNLRLVHAFPAMTADQPQAILDLSDTGLHVINSVAEAKATLLLNARCNAKLDRLDKYPRDRTCCSDYGGKAAVPTAQRLVLAALAAYVVVCLVFEVADILLGSQSNSNALFNMRLASLPVALLSCYAADRTQLMAKGNKEFVAHEFALLMIICLAIGVAALCKTKPRTRPGAPAPTPEAAASFDAGVLSRDQTDEWKGWMQAVILVYHWTGASRFLPVYIFVRLLVAAYLFQTGYGHTIYFLAKKDFSLRRVASVMLRLNLLSCALPYVMNTDYMFYYFAPLVSFWFGVVYLTMRIGARYNDRTGAVLAKIAIAVLLVSGVLNLTPLMGWAFWLLEKMFHIHWDLKEWLFRLHLDGLVVFVGMLAGLAYQRVERNSSPYSTFATYSVPGLLTLVCFTTLCVAFFGYSKPAYTGAHPLLSMMVIPAYVVLRNMTRPLRNVYSGAAAWLGRCSMETFVLQFHILLAADTKGVLLLDALRGGDGSLVWDRWRHLIVIVPVFLWLSSCVADASGAVVQIVMAEPKEVGYEEIEMEPKLELPLAKRRSCVPTNFVSGVGRKAGWGFGDYRARMGMMLGAMWLLNWLY